jgi:hypothetical protein
MTRLRLDGMTVAEHARAERVAQGLPPTDPRGADTGKP